MTDYQTIEPDGDGEFYPIGYLVYEWGRYGRSSVLAGQQSKALVGAFDSLAEAQQAYPKAEVSEWHIDPGNSVPDYLPDWEMTAYEEERLP